jgi:hypothetical protein
MTYFHRPYHLSKIDDIVVERMNAIGAPKIDKRYDVFGSFMLVLLLDAESLSVANR